VNRSFVPGTHGGADIGTSLCKGAALKFLGGVDDDLLGAAMHCPRVRDSAFGQPVILAACRKRQAHCHRKPRRALEEEAKADDCTGRHIGGDSQKGSMR
jgi:hypothetical protein